MSFSPTSERDWARAMPAGFARYASQKRWQAAPHMLLINRILMDLYAGRLTKVILNMPPQNGKTTMISRYGGAHYLGTFPDEELVIASYASEFAATHGRFVRDLINEHGRELWDIGVSPATRAADDWRLVGERDGRKVTGGMRTAGIGSGLTGRPMDFGIIDDPIKDAAQANSAVERQNVWDWYTSVFKTRFKPTTRALIVVTRWHEDDIVGRILASPEGPEWTVISLPAIAEREDDPLGRAIGEPLWPERYPLTYLRKVQATTDEYWWAGLYQQRPAPAGGGIFKKAWWRFWKYSHMDVPPFVVIPVEGEVGIQAPVGVLPQAFDDALQSWDLTFDSASSRVAGGAWRRNGGNFYLMGEAVGEWDFPGQIDALRQFTSLFPYPAKLIEDKANARAMQATARSAIPGIILESVDGDKINRGRAVSPFVRSGNVYLPHPSIAPWVWDYIGEMTSFPNGRYDDRVDQTTQALSALHRRMQMNQGTGQQTHSTASYG